jgi:unsaturated rhamnogalacturonyl hydrolase
MEHRLPTPMRTLPLALGLAVAVSASAQPAYRNPDPRNLDGAPSAVYSTAYHEPSPAEITADLVRVRGFLEAAMPGRLIDTATGSPITDFDHPVPTAAIDRGENGAFSPLDYNVGVIHTGMLSAADATGDPRFKAFTERQLKFLAAAVPYFSAPALHGPRNPLRQVLAPAALDDCGSMLAGLIRARLSGLGPDLKPVIDRWAQWVSHGQYRLPDRTLARQRPQPVSLWADDLYMGVEPLAQLGRMTGDPAYCDDAARDLVQTAQRLFRPAVGLFAHGWSEDSPGVPDFYWGRANGWAMLAMCDLLDVLPAEHPRRTAILEILRAQVRAVASLQSGEGRWHQMLDRADSYLETSCSGMFVYGIAHAINRGWIAAPTYGPIALAGWAGVAGQINARGQVEQACVGTTYAGDMTYYYHRPVSVYALHGYGPTLLAGAELIRLVRASAWTVQFKNQAYHFVPRP